MTTPHLYFDKICCQGNKETLDTIPNQKGINVREELLKFHSTHYSSNMMCLSVLGRGKCVDIFSMLNIVKCCSHVVYMKYRIAQMVNGKNIDK